MTNKDRNNSNPRQPKPSDGSGSADGLFRSNRSFGSDGSDLNVDFENLPEELIQAIKANSELNPSDFCSQELLSWLTSDSGNLKILLNEVLTENMDVSEMLKRDASFKTRIQEPDYESIGLPDHFFDGLENRIKANLVTANNERTASSHSLSDSAISIDELSFESNADDYSALFDRTDDIERASSEELNANQHTVSFRPKNPPESDSSQSVKNRKAPKSRKNWIATVAASLLLVAASITTFVLMQPQPPAPVATVSAETVCNESLSWNPNHISGDWSFDDAPVNRAYPSHLMKYRSQGWKKIALDFDGDAVVYNLIPIDDLSQPKAYLYVFSAMDESFDLPQEFRLSPNANLKYRRWSLACQQQDLVYVLVYDSDQADRVLNLVKAQEVG